MKDTTTIDRAGRLVIPKPLRERYGLESGQRVRLIAGDEGVTIVPDRPKRRFVRYGPILAIDTGGEVGTLSDFDVSRIREEHLKGKAHADRD
jgi:AbrB family looped-hinge helix DNA binding protein